MPSERMKSVIHCAGCGHFVGVPSENAKVLEGIVWCATCFENDVPKKKRGKTGIARRCKHENGWISVDAHKVFVNHAGVMMLSGRARGGRVQMVCNVRGCGATKSIPIRAMKLAVD